MKVAIHSNPVAQGWDPTDPDSWGGGEEAIVLFSEALVRRGHEVHVFYNDSSPEQTPFRQRDVNFAQYQAMKPGGFDVVIHRKTPGDANLQIAERKVLWTDQVVPFDAEPFRKIIVASKFLVRSIASLCPKSDELLLQIPDGYIPELLKRSNGDRPREPMEVLFCSSPDRGLERLIDGWPEVCKARPEARLVVTYGWELFLRCGGDPLLKGRIQKKMASWDESIRSTVRMTRHSFEEIHQRFRSSGVWAFPCEGGEFFCQSAVKAQVGGCYPVVKPWGALHETVWRGTRVQSFEDFPGALIKALDVKKQQTDRKHKPPKEYALPWDGVAERWEKEVLIPATAEGKLEPISKKKLRRIQSTPQLLPNFPPHAAQILAQNIGGWLSQIDASKPWIDPMMGVQFNCNGRPIVNPVSIREADAVVLGWMLEDVNIPVEKRLDELGLKDGTYVAAAFSLGNWRAEKRFRAFDRLDLLELFGNEPELNINISKMDDRGNGVAIPMFKLQRDRFGSRRPARVLGRKAPRETLAACFISRDSRGTFLKTLRSIERIVDQVVIVDTGSENLDLEKELIDRWKHGKDIEVEVVDGTSPRWCYDCGREHELGEFQPGHRIAGFECARNESISRARTDWILWMDTDEEMRGAEELHRYLRPNIFQGYALRQHHLALGDQGPYKIDYPVRCFRRTPDPEALIGLHPWGPLDWPTHFTGLEQRFTGVVHEHPGHKEHVTEGLKDVIGLNGIDIAHTGYYTEEDRRGRFIRNWPLMVSDRAKYPDRKLGRFLWMRDIHHYLRYLMMIQQGRMTQDTLDMIEMLLALWDEYCAPSWEQFTADAHAYSSIAARAIARGFDVKARIEFKKPEVSGDEMVVMEYDGRVKDYEQWEQMIHARGGELRRWIGPYL